MAATTFDAFLQKHGIKERPKAGRTLNTVIPIKGQGLSMSFEIDPLGTESRPGAQAPSFFPA